MAKWKYTKEKRINEARYMSFEEGQTKKLVVTNWSFDRGVAGYLFRCYVEKEDGEPVDKIWCVWNFDSGERLKKKLGTKYRSGSKEITVTAKKNEEEEQTFDIQ